MTSNPDVRDTAVEASWISRTADLAIEHAKRTEASTIVCASGISPSGPIHLGNLREVMAAHLVAEQYPAGAYNTQIRRAMDAREQIFTILEGFQTEGRHEKPVDERRAQYYPFKPYCEVCGTDFTEVTGWADGAVSYRCRCGHHGAMSLADGARISGKLVWKVDWPMRWAFEHVAFEPTGEDHHAPSSSFASGKVLVRDIFGGEAPSTTVYSFVRVAGGGAKLSSSAGGAATPDTALDILEPAMVRWLYARRLPSNSFTIDMAPSAVLRLYDEWDRFSARAATGDASPVETHLHQMSVRTSAGPVESSARPVSFRLPICGRRSSG